MKSQNKLENIQKFICKKDCIFCTKVSRILLESRASSHWNSQNRDKHISCSRSSSYSISSKSQANIPNGGRIHEIEADRVKRRGEMLKINLFDFHSELRRFFIYKSGKKDQNNLKFGSKIDVTKLIFPKNVKRRKIESSFLACSPIPPWSKPKQLNISATLGQNVQEDVGSPPAGGTGSQFGRCGDRIDQKKKPIEDKTLKYALDVALQSVETRANEVKSPVKTTAEGGVSFKGYQPLANRNQLFEEAFGKLPVFDNKSSQLGVGSTSSIVSGSDVGSLSNRAGFNINTPLSGFSIPSAPDTPLSNAPVSGALYMPFPILPQQGTTATPSADVNPFLPQFSGSRRRKRK